MTALPMAAAAAAGKPALDMNAGVLPRVLEHAKG